MATTPTRRRNPLSPNICTTNPTTTTTTMHRRRLRQPPLLLPLLLMVLGALGACLADGDWQNYCEPCHCTWSSGKKQADCKSKSFTAVPDKLTSDLQVIDLSYNQIAELRDGEFEDADLSNMHKMYMRNCTVQEINRNAFRGLGVLIELDLSYNLIRVLHPGTFRDTKRLRSLLLNGNQLERLDDLLFDDLQFLSKLEVRANRLHHVGLRTFHKTPNVNSIDLAANRLAQLRPETFADLLNLKALSLANNPWNCTCSLQQFQNYTITNNLYTPPTSCGQPAHLRGKLWSELSAENFACKPRIVQPQGGVTAVEATGDNVTLVCRINGSPRPSIEWQFGKRPIGFSDQRISIRNSQEVNRVEATDVYTSELTIAGVRSVDRGDYVCTGANMGGKAEAVFRVSMPPSRGFGVGGGGGSAANGGGSGSGGLVHQSASNLLLIVFVVVIVLLVVLMAVIVLLCCYCRRIKKYTKNGSISESGLMAGKVDKSGGAAGLGGSSAANGGSGGGGMGGSGGGGMGDSMLEGSVIMEMQKSLLTDVNPVEKPPRRVELDGGGLGGSADGGLEDGHELKKTLLDETMMYGNQDDETQSVSLSDTTARSRTTYIDDGYGTNLPPDLLAFPSRFAQSPSLQSSISNIPDHSSSTTGLYMHAKSPPSVAGSPIYGGHQQHQQQQQQQPQHHHHQQQHMLHHHPLMNSSSIYAASTSTPAGSGYRTLQLPKQRSHHSQHNHLLLHQHQQQLQQLQQQQQQQQQPQHYPLSMALGTLRSHSPYSTATTMAATNSGPSSVASAASASAYPATVMKQGYVTIPRKPRTPSWTPSLTSTMIADYPLLDGGLTSPTPSMAGTGTASQLQSPIDALIAAEPVYDNLGLRTTASGHSVLNLNKLAAASGNKSAAATAAATAAAANSAGNSFPMKDRPLPATPELNGKLLLQASAAAAPVAAAQSLPPMPQQLMSQSMYAGELVAGESLYGSTRGAGKVPPRPPPKPQKKKPTAAATSAATDATEPQTASGHLFEDECEDGTEV